MSIASLYDQTLARLAHDHPLLGTALLRHRSMRHKPISFKERPYLVELYTILAIDYDPSCDGVDIVKAPQTGQTEIGIQLSLYEAGWLGRLVGYVLPVDRVRDRFVSTRINPLLMDVPAYRRKLPGAELEAMRKAQGQSGETGNLRSKRFGAGLLMFLGAKTDGDFVELSADTIWIDEYDLCEQASAFNLAKAKDRVREGVKPHIHRLGNAEIPRGGITKLYEQGDQRQWHWKCPHCGERQSLDWFENFVRQESDGRWVLRDPEAQGKPHVPVRVECRRCHGFFHRSPEGSAWVPARMGNHRRSYRVTRVEIISTDIHEMFSEWCAAQGQTTLLRAWWRGWWGVAWETASGQITREDIVDACVLPPADWEGGDAYKGLSIVSGLDVGSLINITISKVVRGAGEQIERRNVWTGTVLSEDQTLDVLERYHVRTGTIDEGPEYRLSQSLRDKCKKRGIDLWLCHFNPQPRVGKEAFAMKLDHRSRRVTVDRTQLLDTSADQIRAGAALGRLYTASGLTPPPDPTTGDKAQREAAEASLRSVADPGSTGARLWPQDTPDVLGFVEQMKAARRIMTPDGKIEWTKGPPDHYRLADSYELLAWAIDQRGGRLI